MAYLLSKLTFVKSQPSNSSDIFASLSRGNVLFGTGNTYTDPATGAIWINVRVPPGTLDGWIPKGNCSEVADPGPEPLDQAALVRECTLADRVLNGCDDMVPWFVTADFIIARAIFETGITQTHFDPPYCDGPFKLGTGEWQNLLEAKLPFAEDYQTTDVIYPMLQVYAAGFRMHSDAKAISAELTKAGSGDDLGPYLPSYLDVFHAYLGGVKFAVGLQQSASDPTKSISDLLGAEDLGSLLARQQFAHMKGTTTSSDFVAKSQAVLADLLDAAFDKIKTYAADELPPSSTPAPWLDVAKAELAAKVSEAASPDRIRTYFQATDYGPVGKSIPNWCGAFVAFCFKQAGIGDIPKGSARAANWKTWESRDVPLGSHDIPLGSVVVLSPAAGTNTSGHVAFFMGFSEDGKSVQLLGGNQSNAVTVMSCAIPRIVAIRARDDANVAIGAANRFDLTAAGIAKKFQVYGDMIVDRFQKAGLTRDPQLIAALANAIAESGLDPAVPPSGTEQSYGLFQCNRAHGLGIGFSVEQLQDPDTNITIVIRAAQQYPAYTSASTVAAAVDAFVRYVERPKNTDNAVNKRMAIAQLLA